MTFKFICLLIVILISTAAQALEQPPTVVSTCTYKGSIVRVDVGELGAVTESEHFQGEIEMAQLTVPSRFFGETDLGPSSAHLQVLGQLLDEKFVLKIAVKNYGQLLVRETRAAPWRANMRPKYYRAKFASPIVNEILKYNPAMGSPTWSSRFPKNETVLNNLEISCRVGPKSKQKSYWFW